MIQFIIYIFIIGILIFVSLIAFKAMKRGIHAKQKLNKKYNYRKSDNKKFIKKKNKI